MGMTGWEVCVCGGGGLRYGVKLFNGRRRI